MLDFKVTLGIDSLLILLTIFFSLGLAVATWRIQQRNYSARVCLVLIVFTISLLALMFVLQQELTPWRNAVYTFISLQMLLGPLVYLYTQVQTQEAFKWQNRHLLHFLPVVVMATLWLWQQPLRESDPFLYSLVGNGAEEIENHRLIHKIGAWISLIAYSIASLHLLQPHVSNMKSKFSELSEVNLNWLKALSWSLLLMTLLGIVIDIARILGAALNFDGGNLQALGPLINIVLIIRYGLHQVDIFPKEVQGTLAEPETSTPIPDTEVPSQISEKKYLTSSLTSSDAARLWARVQSFMQCERVFLEPGLKISELAQQLDVSINHLSETINGYARLSFYDYINGLRIEEAEKMLSDPAQAHLSVTDIGYHAGFNSNSTFYTHFKKHLGQTPRQYRDNALVAAN
ncbi:helix-turn-helix transcriptional regulator [Alteromonas mediterranea]|uniref:helix-turn-helix transcriptional regulator n=1 Tax=Alteromonas mediterranea TaxID=314275 RepID=UPI002FE2DDBA